jgi:hypothetical protein
MIMTYQHARALLNSNFQGLLLLAMAGLTLSCPVAHVGAVDDIPRTAEAVDVPAVDGEDVEGEADTEEAE